MRWIVGLALFHLLVLFSGIWASHPLPNALGQARDLYYTATGAGASFGFFSPNVGNQVLVEFELDDGKRVRLHELVSPEVSLRVTNMYRLFLEAYPKEKLKRSVAASLTAQVFRRFPKTEKVTMVASVYRFPSLAEYAGGLRPETKEVYRITFLINGTTDEG